MCLRGFESLTRSQYAPVGNGNRQLSKCWDLRSTRRGCAFSLVGLVGVAGRENNGEMPEWSKGSACKPDRYTPWVQIPLSPLMAASQLVDGARLISESRKRRRVRFPGGQPPGPCSVPRSSVLGLGEEHVTSHGRRARKGRSLGLQM